MTSVSVAAPPAAAPRFHSETLAYAGLSFSTLAWASAFIAGKFALAEMTPLAVGAWRFAVAALLLAPFALRRQQQSVQTGAWAPLALMMLCGGVVYPWLFLEALAHTSATNTSLLIALNPALTLLFSPVIGERLDRQRLVGIGIALAGAVTVITRGDLAHFESLSAFNHGDLLAVLAAATWAAFNLASRRAVASFAPSLINFAIYAAGGTVLFALGAAESPVQQVLHATAFAVGGVLVMAVMSSVLAGHCFLVGVRTVGVNRTVVFVYLVPALTALLSALLLGEPFCTAQAVGGAAVLGGVYWTNRNGRAGWRAARDASPLPGRTAENRPTSGDAA
jgi:drug/metabolite transporter (DMT)-like permease